jgi:hypothetical protein
MIVWIVRISPASSLELLESLLVDGVEPGLPILPSPKFWLAQPSCSPPATVPVALKSFETQGAHSATRSTSFAPRCDISALR